eukprot:3420725-Alexandrium_andersonii.AAC.1
MRLAWDLHCAPALWPSAGAAAAAARKGTRLPPPLPGRGHAQWFIVGCVMRPGTPRRGVGTPVGGSRHSLRGAAMRPLGLWALPACSALDGCRCGCGGRRRRGGSLLSLIHISEPTRLALI